MSLLTGLLAFLTVMPASNREKKINTPSKTGEKIDIAALNDALDSVAIISDLTHEVATLHSQLSDMTTQRDSAIASNVVLRDRIVAATGALANMQIERDDYRRLAHRMHDAYVLPLNPQSFPQSFPNQAIVDPTRQETVFTYGDGAVARVTDLFTAIGDPGHSHGFAPWNPGDSLAPPVDEQMQAQSQMLQALQDADATRAMLGLQQGVAEPPRNPLEQARQMWAACTCVPGRHDMLTRPYRRG